MPPKRAAKGEKKKNDENAASGSGRTNESEASGSGLTNEIAEPGRGGGRKRSATAKANKRILAEKNDSESEFEEVTVQYRTTPPQKKQKKKTPEPKKLKTPESKKAKKTPETRKKSAEETRMKNKEKYLSNLAAEGPTINNNLDPNRPKNLIDTMNKIKCGSINSVVFTENSISPVINNLSLFKVWLSQTPFQRRITSLAWHPTKPGLACVGNKGGELVLWNVHKHLFSDAEPETEAGPFEGRITGRGPGGSIQSLKFDEISPSKVYTASIEGIVSLRDFEGRGDKVFLETKDWTIWYTGLDVNFEGKSIVAGRSNGDVTLLTLEGEEMWTKRLHKSKCNFVQFNHREPWLMVTSSTDSEVKIWDIRSIRDKSSALAELVHEKAVNSAYFSTSRGDKLLTTDQHSQIRVYQGPYWDLKKTIVHPHRQFQHLSPIKTMEGSFYNQDDVNVPTIDSLQARETSDSLHEASNESLSNKLANNSFHEESNVSLSKLANNSFHEESNVSLSKLANHSFHEASNKSMSELANHSFHKETNESFSDGANESMSSENSSLPMESNRFRTVLDGQELSFDLTDTEGAEKKKESEEESLEIHPVDADKRHYKKDSRFIGDIYTFTFNQEDSLQSDREASSNFEGIAGDDVGGYADLDDGWISPAHLRTMGLNLMSLQPVRGKVLSDSGPKSLSSLKGLTRTISLQEQEASVGPEQEDLTDSILETNMHKILARRIQEGQDVSFRTTKLLTTAYYKLLRDTSLPRLMAPPRPKGKEDPKLSWDTLRQTDRHQLTKIVSGYSAIISSLSEELMKELQNKDNLATEQDCMLESISDLTNSLI